MLNGPAQTVQPVTVRRNKRSCAIIEKLSDSPHAQKHFKHMKKGWEWGKDDA